MIKPGKANIVDEIASFRPVLFRMAMLQLRDKAAAEDVTQEALLAAIETHHKYEGRAALRTWLISILRFKVLDSLRQLKRRGPTIDHSAIENELDTSDLAVLFDDTGCWATPKDAWTNPEAHVSQLDFFRVLEVCLTKLPANSSRVFLMREWLELTSDEICSETGVTAGNLRVLLYRARMQLRSCLDISWDRSQ